MTKKKRILIGMSGGIDSTVAAILLLEQGYELVGATFRTFDTCINSENKGCGSEDSVMAAQALAQSLGIEHHILDFRETFRKHVIANFIDEYAHGRTPNPCVMCNSHIKWGRLMEAAEQYGCDMIATGHYAQIAEYHGHYYLKNAVDTHKDQTYFLWMLTEENLRKTIFPLGGLTKTEVRQIALEHGYTQLAQKAESQEICFIPDNDYRKFLAQEGVKVGAGNYIDSTGKILGIHQGYCNYTIGQRKGLGIALGSPKFVIKIDAEKNCVTLGEREELFAQEVCATNIRIRDLAWLEDSPEVEARIRYKSPAAKGVINFDLGIKDFEFNTRNSKLTIHFSTSVWGVTPGQSLVIYKDGLVVGGGFIYLP